MTKRKASIALETGNESDHSNSTQDNSNSTSATNNTTGTAGNNTNNQQVLNGLSATASNNDNGSHQVGDGSLDHSGQQKSKKERADNWSSAEIQVLHRGIESRRDIFYGPPNQATKRNRELAWDAITKEVNSVSTTPRSLSQVMKKFKNEKCRAKRKFMDAEKEGHNNLNSTSSSINNNCNSNSGTSKNGNATLGAQNHAGNSAGNQPQPPQTLQPQPHHMTTETISTQSSSAINVVKIAPHMNVAKTMIDLPGHMQQLQMPGDDMVLIVQPEDGLLSGMNIVSDGNGHHHFQKGASNGGLNNQQHNHHGHPTLQAINAGQGLVNGTMGNGMMARTIPTCSLVYSTGGDVIGADPHLTGGVTGANQIPTNHLGINSQGLMHHRGPIDQGQAQQQPPTQQQQHPHHHSMHPHPHPHQQQPPPHQQPQQQHQQQQQHHQLQQPSQHQHQPPSHHQQPIQQSQIATTGSISNTGGVAVESQLKNLLFNLLLKDGQAATLVNSGQDINKQRNDILGVIAGTLGKIEGHLSKISKVASSMLVHGMATSQNDNNQGMNSNNQTGGLSITGNDDNNNSVSITGPNTTGVMTNSQTGPDT